MEGPITKAMHRLRARGVPRPRTTPLLTELFQDVGGEELESYSIQPFAYTIRRSRDCVSYQVVPDLSAGELSLVRETVAYISATLRPPPEVPPSFNGLVEGLSQSAASRLASIRDAGRVRALSGLAAFEAVGIPTIYCLSLDDLVSEFYLDAPGAPLYLDHAKYGRCETGLSLTERERKAIETHMDTFKGYTIDFSNPSLKNEFDIFGKRLRVSLDLAPLAVSTFSLDVRKLTSSVLGVTDLVRMNVLTAESAALLVAALELGMNVTIVGETGTGKTTLLNALDEAVNPRLRRIYVEDAVETKDLLAEGYHQVKLKVDPFERVAEGSRTKSAEITKILHRSPDMVILGEIQSEEHSRAFFHALSAGIRGLQTFHASSASLAVRRWKEMHAVSDANLLDLDFIVQMARPEKLGSERLVIGVSLMAEEDGPTLRELYARRGDEGLVRTAAWDALQIRKPSVTREQLLERLESIREGIDASCPRVNA